MSEKNVRFLNPISIDTQKEKYCRFKAKGFTYIDYKDPDFLLMLCNEQGKILPRRITGNCATIQRKLQAEIKRARVLALLGYTSIGPNSN